MTSAYFCTDCVTYSHDAWNQVFTSDGTTELFTIKWVFASFKTLADRMADAVSTGEAVTWTVTDASGATYTYSGTWRYSHSAGITTSRFTTSSSRGFSSDDGLWMAGSGTVDGNNGGMGVWGHGNYNSGDSAKCSQVYTGSSTSYTRYSSMKTYLSVTSATAQPSVSPLPTVAAPPAVTTASRVPEHSAKPASSST